MSLTKDRVVIVCVVFKYRGFIGVKGYNIDKDSFIDIFYDSLYLFDIWGLTEEAKKYLNKYKKLKNEPLFKNTIEKETKNFRCSKDFIGYRDLPEIDIGTGDFVNIKNKIVAYSINKKNDKTFCIIDNNGVFGSFSSRYIQLLRSEYNVKFVNITDDNTKIVPLCDKFYIKNLIYKRKNKDKLSEFEEVLGFQERELRNEYRRKLNIFLQDSLKQSKDKFEEQKFFMNRFLGCSSDFYNVLSKNGYQNIFKNKQQMHEISHFIDTESLLKEFDLLNNSPCKDEKCTEALKGIKKETNLYGSYSAREIEVANKIREKNNIFFSKKICRDCYTILNLYGLSYLKLNENASGFMRHSEYMPDSIFVDITEKEIFTLNSFKVLVHEYVHYLSMSEVGVGIYNTVDISNYNNAFKLLNEGITELLTCYLVGNELKVRNKDEIELDYNGKVLKKSDYKSNLNPYLKSLNSFYPEVNDFIKTGGLLDKRILMGYRYEVYLICKIMQDIGVKKVIDCFFTNNFSIFNDLCKKYYTKVVWENFLKIINEESLKRITYFEALQILM